MLAFHLPTTVDKEPKESSDKMKFELDTGDRIYQTSEITEELIKDCIDRLSRDKMVLLQSFPKEYRSPSLTF